jgi:hypothetical protein
MSPMTPALILYWHRLPAESPVARRKALEAIRERVRTGLEPRSALMPFAIGDVDDGIVAAATQAYVTASVRSDDTEAACEATEWVRRGLALNRGAVFGALLALDEGQVLDQLAGLRLVLSAAEVEAACRVLGAGPGPRATRFLRDWRDLVADGPLAREHRVLSVLLDAGGCAQAA